MTITYRARWPSGCKRMATEYTEIWHIKPGPKDPQSSYSLLALFPTASANSLWQSIAFYLQRTAVLRVSVLLNTAYLHLAWHSPNDWFHKPLCLTTSYHRNICYSAYTLCLQNFHKRHTCVCDPFAYLLEKK